MSEGRRRRRRGEEKEERGGGGGGGGRRREEEGAFRPDEKPPRKGGEVPETNQNSVWSIIEPGAEAPTESSKRPSGPDSQR